MEQTFTQQIHTHTQALQKHPEALLEQKKQKIQDGKPNKQPTDRTNELYDSQFLDIDPEMMKKLQMIEKSKKANNQQKEKPGKIQVILKVLSPSERKEEEAAIKKEFVLKLKKWDRQREELKIRKQQVEQKKLKLKEELSLKKQQEQQEERMFLRLQKQKQLEQKIQQIQERRQKREESLKNALLKRSYNHIPSYAQSEQKILQQKQEPIQVSMKLLRDKKRLAKMDPQELKQHQKAYIQRIKERLNMVPRRQEKAKSDFNLYLRRSEEKRQQNITKIIKMKQYQQKINSIPIRIDESKKEEKLIQIDKINNPQKYHLLSQKLLNDQQIYQEFKNFSINIDRKELGINYLNELKQAHLQLSNRSPVRKSNSQQLNHNPEEKLPAIISRQEFPKLPKQQEKSKSVEVPSEAYRHSLEKNRERDSRYMKALHQKLARAVDM